MEDSSHTDDETTGKRILELQVSLALLSTGKGSKTLPGYADPLGRVPFQHPALDGAEALMGTATGYYLHHKQISVLAESYGIPELVRWWPYRVRRSLQRRRSEANTTAEEQPGRIWLRYGLHTSGPCYTGRNRAGARRINGQQDSQRACTYSHGLETCGIRAQRLYGWFNIKLARHRHVMHANA
jgi:hypothetical protein